MRPLDGVTILDLTRLVPGGWATLLLADLGADVIKIEDPRGGDPTRWLPPIVDDSSVYFQVLSRDKRSVTLDLRHPDGLAILDRLLERADVVVESFRPHTARRLGVDAATLRARRPRLVHCAITGFGQTGPYAERAGHDLNYVALAGLLDLDRGPDGAPRLPEMFVADIGAGAMTAVTGILAALVARARTGAGAAVDVSMHEAALAWLAVPAASELVQGARDPAGLPTRGHLACYNVYRTADGEYVALGALEEKFWARFCDAIGRPDLTPLQYAEGATQARVIGEVALIATRTRDEWVRALEPADACLTPVNRVAEALADPHVLARGTVVAVGGRRVVRAPLRMDAPEEAAGSARAVRPAPALGADTDAVLEALGFDAARRRAWRVAGVI